MNEMRTPHALKRARLWLTAAALALLAGSLTALAGTDSTEPKKPNTKPSSFAPHPTKKRTFGTPIQPVILHKHHRQARPAPKDTGTAATGHDATDTHPIAPGEPPK